MKVLVVESDEATREALQDLLLLRWPNMTILTASDGEGGVFMAQTERPDLILLGEDGRAPQGAINAETAHALRVTSETRAIPMIALMMLRLDQHEPMLGLNAYDAWLLKPFSAERLFRVVSPFARKETADTRVVSG